MREQVFQALCCRWPSKFGAPLCLEIGKGCATLNHSIFISADRRLESPTCTVSKIREALLGHCSYMISHGHLSHDLADFPYWKTLPNLRDWFIRRVQQAQVSPHFGISICTRTFSIYKILLHRTSSDHSMLLE
jgi:hypothetical protein